MVTNRSGRLTRRRFLASTVTRVSALALLKPFLSSVAAPQAAEKLPPVRQITRGPRFHWFGYYDKFQFSSNDRLVLGNEVDFEGRSPKADDVISVGMVDLQDHDRWIELGSTRAWNWQQG